MCSLGLKEWIGIAFHADRSFGAVAGNDSYLVGQGEEAVVDGGEKLADVAAGQVGAAYGAGEEGVSGEEESLGWKVEADAAFGVAGVWRMEPVRPVMADDFAVVQGVVGVADGGGRDAEPARLDVHHFDQRAGRCWL